MKKRKSDWLNAGRGLVLVKAKTYLGRLANRAAQGKEVYIVRGSQRFVLQHVPGIEPIPQRPPGFFADCYTREEMELENRLSTASPVEKPDGRAAHIS